MPPHHQPCSSRLGSCDKLIRGYLAELFTFVRDPAVPPTNNDAERSVRHLVISRKIGGGTPSSAGSRTRMRLTSIAATARLQGVTPETAFLRVLREQPAPQAHTL